MEEKLNFGEPRDIELAEKIIIKGLLLDNELSTTILQTFEKEYMEMPFTRLVFGVAKDFYNEYQERIPLDVLTDTIVDDGHWEKGEAIEGIKQIVTSNYPEKYIHDVALEKYKLHVRKIEWVKYQQGTAQGKSVLINSNEINRVESMVSLNGMQKTIQLKFASEFIKNPLPKRNYLLYPIIPEKSITLLSGETGSGKSMFVLALLDAISKGVDFEPWINTSPYRVCYVDGEMDRHELHERMTQMNIGNNFIYWSKDEAYEMDNDLTGDLTQPIWRDHLLKRLIENQVSIVVLDNIASLAPGLDENQKKDWDPINQFLLSLRFAGIAVIIIHHMGKSGTGQRGTSAREDNVDTIIEVNKVADYNAADGARFTIKFKKFRGKPQEGNFLQKREFWYREMDDKWKWDIDDTVSSQEADALILLALATPNKSMKDIAKQFGYSSPSSITKKKKLFIDRGLLDVKGKGKAEVRELTANGQKFMTDQSVDCFFDNTDA
jgi:putative DNA primase/helicase